MLKTLVIFDIDGTLLYSNRVDSRSFATTYEHIYGRPFPTIDWRYYPHVTDHTILSTVIQNHFTRTASLEEINYFQNHFTSLLEQQRKETPEEFLEVPDAQKTVTRLLADDQFVVGIGTGGWHRPATVKLKHVGISPEQLIMSCADGKPTREDILQEAIDEAQKQYKIGRIVYVGDALWDVRTTRNMGLNFIGIRRNGDADLLRNAGASHVFQNYQNFDLFLNAIYQAMPPSMPKT